ncbi:MAG TPA: hypothetical protein VK760_05365, partial [Candidatus Acidoferrales bacterium]|nr:hypothetical protein [Candidatus Acidoferrales bacterium]
VPANFACVPVTSATLAIEEAGIACNQAIFQVAAGFTSRFAVYALDIDGNIMLGPGAPAFSALATGFTFATKGNVISLTPPTIDANLSALTITATSPACQLSGAVCSVSVAIAFDSMVAIASPANNSVVLFSRLQIQAGAGVPYATITGVSAPTAVAFDGNGNLFIAGGSTQSTSVVKEYAPPYTVGAAATMKTNLNEPYAMAIGKNGSLGVLNGGTSTAEVFVPPYTAAPKEAPLATTDATALAFDQNENLWISFFSNGVERFPLAFSYAAVDTLLNGGNGITHPTALQVDTTGNLYVGEGQIDQFPSPYNGMPALSSNALANITSMQLDGVHGFIAACGNTEIGFFKTNALDESYLRNTPATCSLAFDRFHNLEAVYGGSSNATAFVFDPSFVTWLPQRTFTSTAMNEPSAVATWP